MNDANNEQDIEAIKLRVAHQNISILIDRAEAAEKRVTELEAELREAESPRHPSTDVLDGSLVLTTAGVTMSIDAYNKLIQCCAGNGKGGHREDCVWAELARTKLALSELREVSQHPVPAPEKLQP